MSYKKDAMTNRYFRWLVDIVCHDQYKPYRRSHRRMLQYLFERDFDLFIIDADFNRAEDGINLRSRFGDDLLLPEKDVKRYLNGPCSVLEMMVGLAVRCETHIMSDSSAGNRTGRWFWEMVSNLGLDDLNDQNYDECAADLAIDGLINRDYRRDGKGSLFWVKNSREDLTRVEIWYQMCAYMSDILNEEGKYNE